MTGDDHAPTLRKPNKVAGLQYLTLHYAARFDHMQVKNMSARVGQLT